MKPALTAEEWAKPPDTYSLCVEWDGHEHALAALALYGQPFGFTREDVVLLQKLSRYASEAAPQQFEREDDDATPYFQAGIDALVLADRIEALLPKEGA